MNVYDEYHRSILFNVPVNCHGHVETATSDFVGLIPDIEMDDTSSSAINKHRPGKQLRRSDIPEQV